MLLPLPTLAKAQVLFGWRSLQQGTLNLNLHQSLFQKKWLRMVTSGWWPTVGRSLSKYPTGHALYYLSRHQNWALASGPCWSSLK